MVLGGRAAATGGGCPAGGWWPGGTGGTGEAGEAGEPAVNQGRARAGERWGSDKTRHPSY